VTPAMTLKVETKRWRPSEILAWRVLESR